MERSGVVPHLLMERSGSDRCKDLLDHGPPYEYRLASAGETVNPVQGEVWDHARSFHKEVWDHARSFHKEVWDHARPAIWSGPPFQEFSSYQRILVMEVHKGRGWGGWVHGYVPTQNRVGGIGVHTRDSEPTVPGRRLGQLDDKLRKWAVDSACRGSALMGSTLRRGRGEVEVDVGVKKWWPAREPQLLKQMAARKRADLPPPPCPPPPSAKCSRQGGP
eukprot:gene10128-biopygen10799